MASAATMSYPQPAHRHQSARVGGSSRTPRHSDVIDRYYGHREVSELCESVITALFACPLDSSSSSVNVPSSNQRNTTPRLAEFIAYALHRTRLPEEITFQALFLLRRLKSRFPAAKGSSGHRLFISALMLASKSSCDDTYSNKSWTVVSQGLFSLREVNQMERELFGYLGFRVNVEMEELSMFKTLLMTGDVLAVVDCVAPSPRTSPNPATVSSARSSPTLDRGCDTPVAAHSRSTSASVDSAAFNPRHASSTRRSNHVSVSSYPGDVHSTVPTAYTTSPNIDSPYTQHPYQSTYQVNDTNNLSPSSDSVASSRGSFSAASGYSMTPSPSSMSHSGSSSSRNTPDTPPSELASSPYTNTTEGKPFNYNGEPMSIYDENHHYYMNHPQENVDYVLSSNPAHVYASSAMAESTRSRHPFHV